MARFAGFVDEKTQGLFPALRYKAIAVGSIVSVIPGLINVLNKLPCACRRFVRLLRDRPMIRPATLNQTWADVK
jgi:hypothetical protein